MSTVTDAAPETQFATSIRELNDIRSRDPGRVKRLLATRRKRELFGPDGKLMIIACDHPARGALSAGGKATAMASRTDLLAGCLGGQAGVRLDEPRRPAGRCLRDR